MKRCALFRPLLSKATSLQSKSRGLKPINRGRARATLNVLKGLKKMLRITTSHSAEAAKNYFDVALKTSDYYTKDVGTWGKGGEILELKGDVQRKDFVAVANNERLGANEKRLTARMNKTRLEDVIDKTGVPTIAQTWSMQTKSKPP
jgi:hypothetical protein